MLKRRITGADPLEVGWAVGLAVFVVGTAWFVLRLLNPLSVDDISDLGRDLIGARAAIAGQSPYQPLGEIEQIVPHLEVSESDEALWIPHTPLSIALARGLSVAVGENAESLARVVGVMACILLMAYVLRRLRFDLPVRFLLVGALALSFGLNEDIAWLQGAALLGVAIAVALELAQRGKRYAAIGVLAVCVAWRPWCAPLALFIPGSESPYRDATWVGVGALALTLASLPFTGGFTSILDWIRDALPGNLQTYLPNPGNASLLVRSLGTTASLVLLAVITLVIARPGWRRDRHQPLSLASLSILALFPIVWSFYWVGLFPALLSDRTNEEGVVLGLAFVLMADPLMLQSSNYWRAGSAAAIFVLVLWHLGAMWSVRLGSRRKPVA
jgi:hypothetical protein